MKYSCGKLGGTEHLNILNVKMIYSFSNMQLLMRTFDVKDIFWNGKNATK